MVQDLDTGVRVPARGGVLALLPRDRGRRRAVRRRGQAAGRVLRGARRGGLPSARGRLRVRPRRGPARDRRRQARRHRLPPPGGLRRPAPRPATPSPGGAPVEPFLGACRRHGAGIFCLVRTSNAGAADVQDVSLSDGRTLWQHVAGLLREGGTDPAGERGLARRGGGGGQGARAAAVAGAFPSGPASALVAASRSIIYAHRGSDADWRAAAGAEAARLASEVWAASGW